MGKATNKSKGYIYTVTHPDYGTATIIAEDRIQASKDACRAWGAPWVHEGQRCTVFAKGNAESNAGGK